MQLALIFQSKDREKLYSLQSQSLPKIKPQLHRTSARVCISCRPSASAPLLARSAPLCLLAPSNEGRTCFMLPDGEHGAATRASTTRDGDTEGLASISISKSTHIAEGAKLCRNMQLCSCHRKTNQVHKRNGQRPRTIALGSRSLFRCVADRT